jgi:hypothetical protein
VRVNGHDHDSLVSPVVSGVFATETTARWGFGGPTELVQWVSGSVVLSLGRLQLWTAASEELT